MVNTDSFVKKNNELNVGENEVNQLVYKQLCNLGWKSGLGLGLNNNGRLYPVTSKLKTYFQLEDKEDFIKDVNVLMHAISNQHNKKRFICPGTVKQCHNCTLTSHYRAVTTVFSDEIDDYEKELETPLVELPEIMVQINSVKTKGLIDTGSQITCISYTLYNILLGNSGKMSEMPIPAIQIQGAVGRKSDKVNKMCLITLNIDGIELDTPCLVVKKLTRPLILGMDWLERVKAKVDCSKERVLQFEHHKGVVQITLKIDSTKRKNESEYNTSRNKGSTSQGGEKVLDSVNESSGIQGQGGEISMHTINSTNSNNNQNCVDLGFATEDKITEFLRKQNMSLESKRVLLPVLLTNRTVFADKPGRTNKYKHKIKMIDPVPFVKRSYPVPFSHRKQVEDKIKEFEQMGIIKRESTGYCSPLTFTLKRDGSVRLLLDARELNKRMEGDVESPLLTSEILQSFHGVQFMTILDLNDAYFQIPLEKESTKYTGFTYNGKSYTYNVLPQGLKTSVGSFSRAIDLILGPEVKDFCVAYLDDLCVFTKGENNKDLQLHADHIGRVLQKLREAGLTCKLEKCNFLQKEVKLLGHIVSTEGIKMDPNKIEAIKNFPAPKTVKQLRAFLGLLNYYRKFIQNYGELTKSLNDLLCKGCYFKWTEREQESFERLKQKFLDTVMLTHPMLGKPYYLQTDSSAIGVAGCLYQNDENDNQRVIGYCSKALTVAEKNWSVSEQELWAIIYSLKRFETYLRGVHFIIKTDHKSLLYLQNWKLCGARIVRWMLYLGQFSYDVEHVRGVDNVAVDVLSRYLPGTIGIQETKIKCPEIAIFQYKKQKELIKKISNLAEKQKQDKSLREIIKAVQEPGVLTKGINKKQYYLEQDILKYKGREESEGVPVIPNHMQNELIKNVHEELGHFGTKKVYVVMKHRFYFPSMKKIINEYISTYDICQKSKHEVRTYVGNCKPVISDGIGELVFSDLYGPLPTSKFGNRYICVVQDSFSKYIKLYPLRNATGASVLRSVKDYHRKIPIKHIVTDNGTQFTSKVWENGLRDLNIKFSHTTIRNPRPNSVERVNKELGRFFRTYCSHSHKSWTNIVSDIENCYNDTEHESTKHTPNQIVYGKNTKLSLDHTLSKYCVVDHKVNDLNALREGVKENLIKAAERRKLTFNKTHNIRTYQIGDWVKLKILNKSDARQKITKKFSLLFQGPYRIGAVPYHNVYMLVCPETGNIIGNYNAVHIARYYISKTENKFATI